MQRATGAYVFEKQDRGSTKRVKRLADYAVNKYYGDFTNWNKKKSQVVSEIGQSTIITDIKQHANAFNNAELIIRKDELIVGARKRDDQIKIQYSDGTYDYQESDSGWLPDGDISYVEVFKKNTPPNRPDLYEKIMQGEYSPQGCFNHKDVDYFGLVKTGTRALINRAKEVEDSSIGIAKDVATAYIIGHESIINYANRYADEYEKLYKKTKNDEHSEIAAICRNVPENPAKTFHEALQSFWFLYMLAGDGIGRPDIHLYEYYKNDIENNILTKVKAFELIECMFIKLHSDYSAGVQNVSAIQTMTLGGALENGEDACNELTMLFLKAVESVSLLRPSIYIRVTPDTPDEIMQQSVRMLEGGLGQPAFFCDKPVIKGLTDIGISLVDARNYCISGCAEVVSGNSTGNWGAPNGWINIAYITDKTLREMKGTFDEVIFWQKLKDNFDITVVDIKVNLEYMDSVNSDNKVDVMLLSPVCLENGNTPSAGGMDTNMSHWEGIGLANAADMTANAMILAEREISLEDAFVRLDGEEDVFNAMLRDMPKFGNSIDDVDKVAARILDIVAESIKNAATDFRTHAVLGHLSGGENMHIGYGIKMNATLDGRKKGETLADSLAGTQGTNKSGPTAVIKSLCELDHSKLIAGNVSTLRLSPNMAKTKDGLNKTVALIKTFEKLGGSQLQINFIDAETLKKAQDDPLKYKGLIVRVAGYSADFTGLGRTLQDEIIARC